MIIKMKYNAASHQRSNPFITLLVITIVTSLFFAVSTMAQATPKPGDKLTLTVNDVEFVFCHIPAGEFMMGSPENEVGRDEETEKLHKVLISKPFYMMETPITQKQLMALTKDARALAKCRFKGDNNPVENQFNMIAQAKTVCEKLGEATGKKFRLPTEAEWEYACRAGTTTPFHYGEDLDWTMANFAGFKPYGKGTKGKLRNKTTEVKQFQPNTWGLYDMHGNVAELCVDHILPDTDMYADGIVDPGAADPEFIGMIRDTVAYFPEREVNPKAGKPRDKDTLTITRMGTKAETIEADPKKVIYSKQVVRGGAYNVGAAECRSASKSIDYAPNLEVDYVGYRLVLIPE